jgi:hypothetical protein
LIKLQDRTRIRTTPEQIFGWLESLPQHYLSWHPDHIACRVLKGSMLQVGSEIQCEEVLHGKLHAMRMRLTRIEVGRRLEYEVVGLGKGAFEAIQSGEQVEFVADLDLGTDAPLIGQLFDIVFQILFRRRLEAMRQHMSEEGQNLKIILEAGWETRLCKSCLLSALFCFKSS